MSISAAENHYKWRVQIGYHYRSPMSKPAWSLCGHGCMVHPRIILTSFKVWEKTLDHHFRDHDPLYKASVSIGDADYDCRLGHADEARDLAAVILSKPVVDGEGSEMKEFPEMAEGLPAPGQPLGVLVEQNLTGERGASWRHERSGIYLCFTYGYTSLLRGNDESLFALSGVLTNERYVGAAVFDNAGRIYGLVTDYLKHPVDRSHEHIAEGAGRFVVFSPIHKFAKDALALPDSQPSEGDASSE